MQGQEKQALLYDPAIYSWVNAQEQQKHELKKVLWKNVYTNFPHDSLQYNRIPLNNKKERTT